jgi:hypothetical protein
MTVEFPGFIEVKKTPESIAVAKDERIKLLELQQKIMSQLKVHSNTNDPHWKYKARRKLSVITVRLAFLKDWIKAKNVEAAKELVLAQCGGDLEDPVELIASLRRLISRAKREGLRLTPEEQQVFNASTLYLQIIVKSDLEEADARDKTGS